MFRGFREEVEALDLDFTLLGSLVVKMNYDGTEESVSIPHLENCVEVSLSVVVFTNMIVSLSYNFFKLNQIFCLLDFGR